MDARLHLAMRSTSLRGVLGWLAAGLMFLLGPMCAWGYPRGDSLPGVSHLGRAYDLAVGRTATFAYDASGNLTNDGRRSFTYDARGRLESITVPNAWRTRFVHDGLNRLRVRTELTWSGGAWVTNAVVRYVYAGGLVVEERNGSNNATTLAYTRGLDLSGSLGGAGGIGGLLALTRYDTPSPPHAWYHADGSGNVTALVNASQYVVARYQYDPFGGLVAQSGPWSEVNRLRFSSKEWHAASGTYGFGRRFYDPGLQRWLNPDPIGIAGGINLYGFVGNNPIGNVDPWGLAIDGDEYGGPMQITGRAFDSVLYDSETRAAHDQEGNGVKHGQWTFLTESDHDM